MSGYFIIDKRSDKLCHGVAIYAILILSVCLNYIIQNHFVKTRTSKTNINFYYLKKKKKHCLQLETFFPSFRTGSCCKKMRVALGPS